MSNLKEIVLPMSVQTLEHGSRHMDAVTLAFDSQDCRIQVELRPYVMKFPPCVPVIL